MSFLRNSAFNFVGGLLPAVALFATIPIILHRMGPDAYGALVLITSIVGYFGIIDVNATAGTVKYVAQHQARGEHDEIGRVVSFGLLIYMAIGLAGAAALFTGAGWLVDSAFKIPLDWRDDALGALQVSALAFFFGQLQLFLQSIPQALGRFDLSGQFDALFGTLVPLATIAVVLGGGGLTAIVITRLVLSVCHCTALLVAVRRLLPGLRLRRPDRATTRKVASFSAFSYLQRLASVTYLNADKLLIGAQQSMSALATYVVPYTLVSRVFALVQRLMQAIFPLSSQLNARGDRAALKATFIYVSRYITFLNIGVCLTLAIFARELLTYWLHAKPDSRAVLILITVAYGLFIESLSNVPSLVNDGLGRPHITGAAAVLRVGAGVLAAWWVLQWGGIVEVALSQFVVSLVFVTGFLVFVHRRSLPWTLGEVAGQVYGFNFIVLTVGTALVAWRWHEPVLAFWHFVVALLLLLMLLGILGWAVVLLPEHRQRLREVLAPRFLNKLRLRP